MTPDRNLEHDLPDLLRDLYGGTTPEYRQDILWATAQMRQRPAWTFLERWLPITGFDRRGALTQAPPLRVVVMMLLIALLISVALLYVGSIQHLPPPFGLAKNGLIVYAANNDIYTTDPTTGRVVAVVTAPEADSDPRWSLDGTHFVFERRSSSDARFAGLYVARADGSEVTLVTPAEYLGFDGYFFSPDGTDVVFSPSQLESDGLVQTLATAKADGSGITEFDLGIDVDEPVWRPPDGREIVFVGTDTKQAEEQSGLYIVNADGTGLRALVPPSLLFDLAGPKWSPDGTTISYTAWDLRVEEMSARQYLVPASGGTPQMTPLGLGVRWEAAAGWSNDGTKLAVIRSYTGLYEAVYGAVFPADGGGPDIQSDVPMMRDWFFMIMEWSPDDSMILATPFRSPGEPVQQVMFDPATGAVSPGPETTVSVPAWQRLAP